MTRHLILYKKYLAFFCFYFHIFFRGGNMTKSGLDSEFLESQKTALIERREQMKEIMKQGGSIGVINLPESITQIRQAISRINKGLYGLCANCHDNVEIERLKIKPEMTLCLECHLERLEERKVSIR